MRQLIVEIVGFSILCLAVVYGGWQRPAVWNPQPATPQVDPNAEKHKRRPILPWRGEETFGATVGGNTAPDGTPTQCDLPNDRHLKNCGGRDGAGLCVFTSISHSGDWQNVKVLADFRDWMKKYPGGGYPSKVQQMIAKKCQEAGVPEPQYLQVESADLEILKLACKTGRMPGVTYSFSPSGRYGGQRISHMVSLVAAGAGQGPDGKGWYGILDNNYPGSIEWLSEKEFLKTYTGGGRQGWSVILTQPGPPAPPSN